jgi:hypothetical protein
VAADAAGLPKKSTAPRFLRLVERVPVAARYRSMGAFANVSENSNSAIARATISYVIGAPCRTSGNASRRGSGSRARVEAPHAPRL